jgi:osmotically-inducible protein OsmY
MKSFTKPAAFFLAILLSVLLGCAGTSTKESTGEFIDDTVITTKVETFKGTVQMTGFVSSRADINKAVALARNVKGVTAVRNDMRLK